MNLLLKDKSQLAFKSYQMCCLFKMCLVLCFRFKVECVKIWDVSTTQLFNDCKYCI